MDGTSGTSSASDILGVVVEMDTSTVQELGNAPTLPELSALPLPPPAGSELKLKSPTVGKFSGNVIEWDDWQNSSVNVLLATGHGEIADNECKHGSDPEGNQVVCAILPNAAGGGKPPIGVQPRAEPPGMAMPLGDTLGLAWR